MSAAAPPPSGHLGAGPQHAWLNALLEELGRSSGIPGLRADELGACTLVFDGRTHLHIAIEPNCRDLVLWCELGQLPVQEPTVALRRLLRANLFWRETLGATLSLMPDCDDVVLARRYPLAAMDAAILRAEIDALVEAADALPAMLRSTEASGNDASRPPAFFI